MRSRVEQTLIFVCATLLIAAFIARLVTRGGPFFARPATIVEHVGPGKHDARDALVLLPKVAKILPRGVDVTCFRPALGESDPNDTVNFYTAVGQLPRQHVLPPFTAMLSVKRADLVPYVVAVDRPFDHPAYRLIAQFPEGGLYQVQR